MQLKTEGALEQWRSNEEQGRHMAGKKKWTDWIRKKCVLLATKLLAVAGQHV